MFKNSKILEFYIELLFAGFFCNIIPINKHFKRYCGEYTIAIRVVRSAALYTRDIVLEAM